MFAMLSYIYGSTPIAQATQIIVGYLMGARKVEETDRRVNATLRAAMLVSFVISLLLFLLCEPLFGLFTSDPQVLSMCRTIMGIEILLELGRAANIVLFRALQTAGDIRFPICLNVTTVWTVAVGGGYLLGVVLGLGLPGHLDRHDLRRVLPRARLLPALAQRKLALQASARLIGAY